MKTITINKEPRATYVGLLTLIFLTLFNATAGEQVPSDDIISKVIGIDGFELLSKYSGTVEVSATDSVGIDQWGEGFIIRTDTAKENIIVAFKVLPNMESAANKFNFLTVIESTGGSGYTPPKVGDKAVMFGPNRIMLRSENILVTVFSKGMSLNNQKGVESVIKFIDLAIRDRGVGIVTQPLAQESNQ